jgi:hypothetical protein
MLLDKYVLTKAFEKLIMHHASLSEQDAPPSSFVRRVQHCMNRLDPLLKTLQVRPSPPEGLVQAYLIHIGDRSDTNFKKILDLKGVRKADHGHLIELFGIHRDSTTNDKLVASSPLLTPLMTTMSLGNTANLSTMNPSVAAAVSPRFEAGSLGEKLLSAARDISQSSTSTAAQTGLEKATINENLRNFGKFFKRDIGSLGARFGKRDGSVGAEEGQR